MAYIEKGRGLVPALINAKPVRNEDLVLQKMGSPHFNRPTTSESQEMGRSTTTERYTRIQGRRWFTERFGVSD